jgi:cytochrome c oxidase cbb3-type subunit III
MYSQAPWLITLALVVTTMGTRAQAPDRDAGGVRGPTAALERGRTVFVLNTCHFCHGVDLTGATMGAADLMHSPLVGSDQDGNVIGAIVRAGLPNLQTAMPSYAELTPAEITDLARYVHFLRQQGKYRELIQPPVSVQGQAAEGRTFFAGHCETCHSPTGDLAGITRRYDMLTLRARLLRPGPATPAEGAVETTGRAAHLTLLENYTAGQVEDLLAYLRSLR